MLKSTKNAMKLIGLHRVLNYCRFLIKLPLYHLQFLQLYFASRASSRKIKISYIDNYPILNEATKKTAFDRHYVFHTSWAARKVKQISPELHVDISSSLFFCGILSAFQKVVFFDYRPADLGLSNLESQSCDLLSLPFEDNSVSSLSCMHVVEHIGLGRYGDPIDFDGDLKSISELKRVIALGGSLLFVVPIGTEKICFNAHRIYAHHTILELFSGFKLMEFQLIETDEFGGTLIEDPDEATLARQTYGCGCYWFKKHEG